MKHVVLAVALLCAARPASAQAPSEETLKANRDKKLQSPFLAKSPWITDYDKAREEAKKAGKMIFAYFTRSYAN